MSYDLAVLSLDASAGTAAAQAMFVRCSTRNHPEGELNGRTAVFYEELRARFPDYPPCDERTPWMGMPFSTGIDHVIMHLSFARAATRLSGQSRSWRKSTGWSSTTRSPATLSDRPRSRQLILGRDPSGSACVADECGYYAQ